jgi:hypothetical protein
MIERLGARPVAVAALALLGAAPAGLPVAAADEIAWSPNRPLRWTDFRGSVPGSAAPENVATTASIMRWSYAYAVERSGDVCVYQLTSIESTAAFDPEASWVRPQHRTADVLAHEQGHFDLTQIHKLMFDEASRGLLGTSGPCRGRNGKRIARSVERDIANTLGVIYERVWSNHERVQNVYDSETAHGMNETAQQTWRARIAAGLRGRGWEVLGFEDGPALE